LLYIAPDAGRAGAAIIKILNNKLKLYVRRFTENEPPRLEGKNPIEYKLRYLCGSQSNGADSFSFWREAVQVYLKDAKADAENAAENLMQFRKDAKFNCKFL
jgi:hypothetical protein